MSIAERIEGMLPYLRRYARASTGNTISGDACVERVLQRILDMSFDVDFDLERFNRIELYTLLDEALDQLSQSRTAKARRALLLIAVEGFQERTVCQILKVKRTELAELLDMAEQAFAETTATCMLIVEDEPLISSQLKRLSESLGHHVIGIASRASEAVAIRNAHEPDIVLCDIQLADGSLGTDAISSMKLPEQVPVVFVTAHPEQYLSTANQGPSYLITKPFEPDYLKAVIGHALLNVQRG
ncbi:MAG: response regulator [Pseudomonadota bacterium]